MTSPGSATPHTDFVRSGWLRRRGRTATVAIGAAGVVALIAGIDLPHAIATHPVVGLAFMAMIAVAVVSIVALSQRWDHRWLLFGTFASVTLAAYTLGRVDHVVTASAPAKISVLGVTAWACAVILWPSRRH